jgi:hypothetical protein
MVKIVDKQTIFNSGIITSKLISRDDLKQYNQGLSEAYNFMCSKYGPISKRVGTQFIWDLGAPSKAMFTIPFVFSVRQSLVLEFTEKRIRFYTFDGIEFGPIENPDKPGEIYEIETPFTEDVLENISYVQSLDVIYLAIPGGKHKPMELRRKANDKWELIDFVYDDGPYLDRNYQSSKKVKISATGTGEKTITLTGFTLEKTDVGRQIRVNFQKDSDDRWCWGIIKSVAEGGASATIDMQEGAAEANVDSSIWRLGAWSETTGYPTKVTIHEQRLVFAGITDKPWIWMSNAFSYHNFSPSDYNGTMKDNNAIYYDASTDKVSNILWIKSVKSLLVGTELSELRMYSAGTALSPTDCVVNKESSYGSFEAEPVVTDDVIIFIQRLQRTLRSISYDYYRDAYLGPELTLFAESLTQRGIKKVIFQKEPYSILWVLREDGTCITCTFDSAQDVVGWTEVALADGAKIADMLSVPSNAYKQDVVIFFVDREIGGETKRYVELLSREFLDSVEQKDAVFLDCAQRYKAPLDENGNPIPDDEIEGLGYLKGKTVSITANGAYLEDRPVVELTKPDPEDPTKTITYYAVQLSSKVTDAWVGLPYDSHFTTLERDFQDRQLSSKNAKLRIYRLVLYLIRTLGLTVKQVIGGTETELITFSPQCTMDVPPEAITSQEEIDLMTNWTDNSMKYKLRFESHKAMPCTVAGITAGLELNAL